MAGLADRAGAEKFGSQPGNAVRAARVWGSMKPFRRRAAYLTLAITAVILSALGLLVARPADRDDLSVEQVDGPREQADSVDSTSSRPFSQFSTFSQAATRDPTQKFADHEPAGSGSVAQAPRTSKARQQQSRGVVGELLYELHRAFEGRFTEEGRERERKRKAWNGAYTTCFERVNPRLSPADHIAEIKRCREEATDLTRASNHDRELQDGSTTGSP